MMKSNETRSSQRQLNDELDAMYRKMTDPQEIEREHLKKRKQERKKAKKTNYGL
jgi:hypothetical protein